MLIPETIPNSFSVEPFSRTYLFHEQKLKLNNFRMPRLGGDDGGSGGFSRALQKPVDAVTDMFWGIVNFGKFIPARFLRNKNILVVIFFSTMLNLNPPEALRQTGGRTTGRGGGGGGGGGPGRGFKGMNDIK